MKLFTLHKCNKTALGKKDLFEPYCIHTLAEEMNGLNS